jgi:hypothetical protein
VLKLCVECKHHHYNAPECMHECLRDITTRTCLVTGDIFPAGQAYLCNTERLAISEPPPSYCGAIGRYYEAKYVEENSNEQVEN